MSEGGSLGSQNDEEAWKKQNRIWSRPLESRALPTQSDFKNHPSSKKIAKSRNFLMKHNVLLILYIILRGMYENKKMKEHPS